MPFGRFVKIQLKRTLITGIPQIIEANGILRKVIKTLVFCVCVSSCFYQVYSFLEVFYEYPIVVDVFVNTPATVREPAFSICPHNGLLASSYCRKFSEDCTRNRTLYKEDFCKTNFQMCDMDSVDETMDKKFMPIITPDELRQYPNFPNDSGYIRDYYGRITRPGEKFIDSAGIKKGADLTSQPFGVFSGDNLPITCAAFGVVWKEPNKEVNDVPLNLVYEFKVVTDRKSLFYNTIANAVQLAVHDPFEQVNPFSSGISVTACKTYNIYLYKTEKFLLPAPYPTNCTDYIQKWKDNGGEGVLTQKLCIEQCLLEISIKRFGCFNPSIITIPNNESFCFNSTVQPTEEDYYYCRDQCPSACVFISFDTKVEESAVVLPKINIGCYTILYFYLSRLNVMTFTYKKKYESVELFGYIGGYLGMWLGFSLIAAFDFLEVIFTICCYTCRTRKKKAKKMGKVEPVSYYSTPKQMFI